MNLAISASMRVWSLALAALLLAGRGPVEAAGPDLTGRWVLSSGPNAWAILDIKDKEGNVEAWNLEGGSPSALARDGWTSKSLKSGDTLRLTIEPLRSGAPGGA